MAQPTRIARLRSIANRRDAATVRSGRSPLPPPIAAWRMASNSRSRLSPVGARSLAKKLSTSARTWAASASSSCASRSIVSTGIEGLQPRRLAIASEGDLLDPRLCVLQPRLAVSPQPVAFLVERDRLVERRLALLERANDLLEPRKRGLEAQSANVVFSVSHEPWL